MMDFEDDWSDLLRKPGSPPGEPIEFDEDWDDVLARESFYAALADQDGNVIPGTIRRFTYLPREVWNFTARVQAIAHFIVWWQRDARWSVPLSEPWAVGPIYGPVCVHFDGYVGVRYTPSSTITYVWPAGTIVPNVVTTTTGTVNLTSFTVTYVCP